MDRAPAVCTTCGSVFASAFGYGGGHVAIYGSTSGPCPNCGGRGAVPDGIYSTATNVARLVITQRPGDERVEKAIQILRTSRESQLGHEAIRQEFQQNVPELESLADALPKTRIELYAVIAILVPFLLALLNFVRDCVSSAGEVDEDRVKTIVERCLDDAAKPDDDKMKPGGPSTFKPPLH